VTSTQHLLQNIDYRDLNKKAGADPSGGLGSR